MLFYILLEKTPLCLPVCKAGEDCVAGACKCGTAPPCKMDELCENGVCSMYLKSNNPNKIINTKLI
jgi:hypothetical protein